MSNGDLLFKTIIGLAIGVLLAIIMVNIFDAFDEVPKTNETEEQLEKIETSWKITDIISTVGPTIVIILILILYIKSKT